MKAAKEHEEYRRGGGIHRDEKREKDGEFEKRARGGKVEREEEEREERKEKKDHEKKRARGGRLGHADVAHIERHHRKIHVADRKRELKRGGKVEGEETRHRADRRARGGRMTPHSPLSGADVKPLPYYSSIKQPGGTKGAGGERHPRRD